MPPNGCDPIPTTDLRTRLRDEDFLAAMRSSAPAGATLRSAADLEESLEGILAQHSPGADVHVFAYGSLMWNPALEHAGQATAKVHGWHRRFCLRNLVGRGRPGRPGLMLALDRGGSCNGMLLRIAGPSARAELAILWRREMTWGTYDARWVTAIADGARVRAITFVANRRHERYLTDLPVAEEARLIDTGEGSLGTCRAYFDATLAKLGELGIEDRRMERLRQAVCARPARR